MTTNRYGAILLTAAALLAGCASAPDETDSDETTPPVVDASAIPQEALERARGAVREMGSRLMGSLTAELKRGGPVEAIHVCSEIAPSVAAEQSGEGLTIRRVSLKVRNPLDVPDDYERAKLLAWEAPEAGELPAESAELIDVEGGRVLRYMKPIVVMQPCLTCHGDPAAMEPELKRALDERYPDDRATGYAAGDLRGAFTVTVEL
jgi:hypothetical protein